MKTKADTLIQLKNAFEDINILPIYRLQSDRYFSDKESVIDEIIAFADGRKLIVRSSSTREDCEDFSNAGAFESILNVDPEKTVISDAIEKVYKSYSTDSDEQILIQPMLLNIRYSGVVFTSDIETYARYYTVNYSVDGNSASVTSGEGSGLKTYIEYGNSRCVSTDPTLRELISVCRKIQNFYSNDALDIEFASDENEKIYIFQVRPIARGRKENVACPDIDMPLNRIFLKVKKLSMQHPFLLGKTTIFGVMPDWNPAEILGVRPRKLAISLYKELITDSVWAHQRYNYGYRDLTMHPLMISFCGIPYIDTRITFNSFIPRELNTEIAEKLVNYYLGRLEKYPKYHDKVEFEIVFSCYYLGLPNQLKTLLRYGFNENELKRIEFSLLNLTNSIIDAKNGLYREDIAKTRILEKNYNKIIGSEISLVDRIYWLIEECKAYGTLPFAGVARAGFIAVQFLRSFVNVGIISQKEMNDYMNTLDTVNKKMNADLRNLIEGKITKDIFFQRYGHIRPGTYDIMSKRYDEAFDDYFGDNMFFSDDSEEVSFVFSANQKERIQHELDQNGLKINVEELLAFIKESIEGREYVKFVFTKAVSKILQLIEELGQRNCISREDMSYVDISVIKQLYVDLYTGDLKSMFEKNISDNKHQYECALAIKLPSLIVNPEDVYSFFLLDDEPNFITQKNYTGETTEISLDDSSDYSGKVVFIQSADPGYDFLFSKNIGGLITQFGGANSHMAIRCAELGIPAVIGAGEQNFNRWKEYKSLSIDCIKKQVIRIK